MRGGKMRTTMSTQDQLCITRLWALNEALHALNFQIGFQGGLLVTSTVPEITRSRIDRLETAKTELEELIERLAESQGEPS